MRFLDIASSASMYVAGIMTGMFLASIMFFSGDAKVISTQYICTKFAIVGKTPHREERCVQYTYKEATND